MVLSVPDLCRICGKRRPRRYCPGVSGDICSPCCGAEREVTVDCPFHCEYLQEARRHEPLPELKPEDIPNSDIRVTETFLNEHNELVLEVSRLLYSSAMSVSGAVDFDMREALDAMVTTYRTASQSGLIYESRPSNPIAAAIQRNFEQALEAYRQAVASRTGINSIRDAEVLGVLVFFERIERHHNNGRRRGRSFLDLLRRNSAPPDSRLESNLVLA